MLACWPTGQSGRIHIDPTRGAAMASNGGIRNGGSGGAARRLLLHDPGLVREMARSLLEGRKDLPREQRRRIPRRRLLGASGMREAARSGIPVDPDLAYRALEHAIDPKWTRGHRFTLAYELTGEDGGRWEVHVEDGSIAVESRNGSPPAPGADGTGSAPDATVRMSVDTWRRVLAEEITPSSA